MVEKDQQILDGLNELLSVEYTSMIQLLQHSFLLQGIERAAFMEMLRDHAKDTTKHAPELGDKIVARCDERRYVAERVLLENMCYEETQFIEDLERALSLKQFSIQRMPGKIPRVRAS